MEKRDKAWRIHKTKKYIEKRTNYFGISDRKTRYSKSRKPVGFLGSWTKVFGIDNKQSLINEIVEKEQLKLASEIEKETKEKDFVALRNEQMKLIS